MDFTREPIIETVITPREGCKLVVRSSKSTAQEEYFVDAVEVVSFGNSFFFRSLERPKAFLVPTSDYEVLEVREARMVLKNVGMDRSIKIGGGREAQMRTGRDTASQEKPEVQIEEPIESSEKASIEPRAEVKVDKKRERRRHYRRRRGREDQVSESQGAEPEEALLSEQDIGERIELPEPKGQEDIEKGSSSLNFTPLLAPPPNLISETIARYKDNVLFKGVFYSKEEEQPDQEGRGSEEGEVESTPLQEIPISLAQPEYGSFEISETEEEKIYQQRKIQEESHSEDMHDESRLQEEGHGTNQISHSDGGN